MASTGRNTATRDKHRDIIGADEPPCYLDELGLCLFPGEPIDYDADHLDPRAFTVDHIIPLDAGGPDELDNKAAAHRACNRDKSNKTEHTTTKVFITTRTWTP